MALTSILTEIAAARGWELLQSTPLSGGDINAVYLLECNQRSVVIKLNHSNAFPGMFQAEAKGLQLLAATNSFRIPEVIGTGSYKTYEYLLLEYIPKQQPETGIWIEFASNLTKLHKQQRTQFGLDHDNYIGSLPQSNNAHPDAATFYIEERLRPQLVLSRDSGFSLSKAEKAFKNIAHEIPDEPASLLHGDLWSGNFLISETNEAVLIDPAVSFGPREMDLAMMALFGGFSSEVFKQYNEEFPLTEGWKQRQDLWQLYYLWVHLNIFGASYLRRVEDIIKHYS